MRCGGPLSARAAVAAATSLCLAGAAPRWPEVAPIQLAQSVSAVDAAGELEIAVLAATVRWSTVKREGAPDHPRGGVLELLAVVTFTSPDYYRERCHGGVWHAQSEELPCARCTWTCSWSGGHWGSTRAVSGGLPEVPENVSYSKAVRRGDLLRCELPAAAVRPADDGLPAVLRVGGVEVEVVRQGPLDRDALRVPLRLVPAGGRRGASSAGSGAVVACSSCLHGLDWLEEKRPGLIQAWLDWHTAVLGIDLFAVYDTDGTFGRIVDLASNPKVAYYPRFTRNISSALAVVASPQEGPRTHYGLPGNRSATTQEAPCAVEYIAEALFGMHCMHHHRPVGDWVLHIHAPDLWLMPRLSTLDPGPDEEVRTVRDLTARASRNVLLPVVNVGLRAIYEPYGRQIRMSYFELLRLYSRRYRGPSARSRRITWCREGQRRQSWLEVLLKHDIMGQYKPSFAMCRTASTQVFDTHLCQPKCNRREFALWASWHYVHFSALVPVNCDDDFGMKILAIRNLFRMGRTYKPWRALAERLAALEHRAHLRPPLPRPAGLPPAA